jgi:serine/threonine-protein kinase HipA
MTIGGKRSMSDILPRHWERQAASVRFSKDRLLQHMRDLIARLPEAAETVEAQTRDEGLESTIVPRLREARQRRCEFLGRHYGAEQTNVAA